MKFFKYSCVALLLIFLLATPVNAQNLESSNYKILDTTFDSGGGISESTNYKILQSVGNIDLSNRLVGSNYSINSGFISGIEANVPKIRCIETTTISSNTTCLNFPNVNGAIGECGSPGCYDRAKIEIDYQNNPINTLYLVVIIQNGTGNTYYLQDNHTLGISYDINDYMTICELEGKDTRSGSGCAVSTDPLWSSDLQRYNVFSLYPNTSYTVKLRAFIDTFTEVEMITSTNFTTSSYSLSFDIDIAPTHVETSSPHSINLGNILGNTVTSTNKIWFDLNTNSIPGVNLNISDLNNGLKNGSFVIPSTTSDLSTSVTGGFGAQIASFSQDTLGPLIPSTAYNLTSENVGAISTTPTLLFSTNNTGTNKGQIYNGLGSIFLKAKATINNPGGTYSDTVTFTLIPNL